MTEQDKVSGRYFCVNFGQPAFEVSGLDDGTLHPMDRVAHFPDGFDEMQRGEILARLGRRLKSMDKAGMKTSGVSLYAARPRPGNLVGYLFAAGTLCLTSVQVTSSCIVLAISMLTMFVGTDPSDHGALVTRPETSFIAYSLGKSEDRKPTAAQKAKALDDYKAYQAFRDKENGQ